jgi:hypothetical protein
MKAERGHQDGPQAHLGRHLRRREAIFALLFLLLGELHDQNRVLASQADQHDEDDCEGQ